MTKTTTASRLVGWTVSTAALGAICLTGYPSNRLTAQSVDSLPLCFSAMTAVTGYEQAMADSLVALLPGELVSLGDLVRALAEDW